MSAFEQRMSRSTNIYIAPARLKCRVQGRKIPKLMDQKELHNETVLCLVPFVLSLALFIDFA